MSIDLPYTPKPEQSSTGIYVYHLAEDGSSTVMPSSYKEGERMVTFDTTHLSVYAIFCTSMSDTSGIYMAILILISCALLVLTWLVVRRMRVVFAKKES